MVGDVHHLHPVLATERRVLAGGDALQDQGDVVRVLEALDLVPGQGGLVLLARRPEAPRLDEALVEVALAPAVAGCVHGHAEGVVPVVPRALDVVVHEGVVAADVELEDAVVVRGGRRRLETGIAGATEHVGHTEGAGGFARRRAAAGSEGMRTGRPRKVDDTSTFETSRSTRGLKAHESIARRLRLSVVSVSAPPIM